MQQPTASSEYSYTRAAFSLFHKMMRRNNTKLHLRRSRCAFRGTEGAECRTISNGVRASCAREDKREETRLSLFLPECAAVFLTKNRQQNEGGLQYYYKGAEYMKQTDCLASSNFYVGGGSMFLPCTVRRCLDTVIGGFGETELITKPLAIFSFLIETTTHAAIIKHKAAVCLKGHTSRYTKKDD